MGFGIRDSGFARAAATTVTIAVLTLCLTAQQSDRARTEALAQRASDRLQALQREADALAAQEHTLLGDLRKLEVERQLRTEQLRQLDADAEHVAAELNATSSKAAALQAREQADRPALRARLVELYKLGQGRYLRLLLSTTDLRQIGQASRTVAALAALDRQRFTAHERTRQELTAAQATLERRHRELETLREEAVRAQAAASRAAAARDALVRDIDARRDLNAQLAGELQVAQQKLQATLRDLSAGAAAQPVALPLRPFRGDLPWPVGGSVTQRFGRPAAARRGASDGVEIAADEGTPVRAIHGGTVVFAGPFAGFGNLVIVDHGSQTFSLYADLLDVTVARGARIDAGDSLGSVGRSPAGSSALYFELRIDGRPVDPLQWLKKR